MFDIVTIGHATIDYFLKLRDDDVLLSGDEDGDSLICFDFADKIPVAEFQKYVGGNAVNTGVGCSRLGFETAVISWIGADLEGELILRTLKEEGVNPLWVNISDEDSTDQSIILNFEAQRTIFSYHFPRSLFIPKEAPESKFVYLTSSGRSFRELHPQVLNYIGRTGAELAYNPGTYELESGFEENKDVLEHCSILILNSEEAGQFARGEFVNFEEGKRAEQIGEVMYELRELGPEVIVVTDGARGSYGFDGERIAFVPAKDVEVVEMTGAGDGFSAGFLADWVRARDLKEALLWGTVNAASVISHVGCRTGLLSREDLRNQLD